MDVTVKTSYHKHFVVIVHRIGSKKLFRLFEWTVVLLDLVCLRVETKTIRNPTLIPSKNKNFTLIQSETTDCVTSRPLVVFTY
jgi:hypothetical protein